MGATEFLPERTVVDVLQVVQRASRGQRLVGALRGGAKSVAQTRDQRTVVVCDDHE